MVFFMLPNLKLLRKEYGISQQRLAEGIGVSQQSINQYENHAVEPDLAVLARIADYFNTSIDFVVGHTDVRRRIERTEEYHLSQEEQHFIIRYRSLKAHEKACVSTVLDTLLTR